MEKSIRIEIGTKASSQCSLEELQYHCLQHLKDETLKCGLSFSKFSAETHKFLHDNVLCIIINESSVFKDKILCLNECTIRWSTYVIHKAGCELEVEQLDDTEIQYGSTYILPNYEFCNLWENLIFDSDIKLQLVRYVKTAMLFTEKRIDRNIINYNRIVLLHGPPGTGKTTLCKALAHKLAGHLHSRYKKSFLMEINSHSLFSKWFSESGKIVSKIFRKIENDLQDESMLLFILLDEVESISHVRMAPKDSKEPSDSIRSVNALLTEIDRIKNRPNVIILATSNLANAIDAAFVDRADIVQYIGPPNPIAIYWILKACTEELMEKQVIQPAVELLPYFQLRGFNINSESLDKSRHLYKIAEMCEGISGRTLRKMPFLAHAHVGTAKLSVTLDGWLHSLMCLAEHYKVENSTHLSKGFKNDLC